MKWHEYLKLQLKNSRRPVIVGVGSELKSDDAVGKLVADLLTKQLADCEQVLVLYGSTAPENCTGQIKKFAPDHVFMVDAAHMNLEAGKIDIIDLEKIKNISFSTHMLPLSLMLNYLLEEVGCLISLIGIEPVSTEFGFEIDPKVQEAAKRLVDVFVKALIH